MSYFEELLGRKLAVDDRGTIESLNEVPADLLDEARHLATKSLPAAVQYLEFYVRRRDEVQDFVEEVLVGGADASTWRIRDLLCYPQLDLGALCRISVREYIGSLRSIDGERWYRLAPDHRAAHSDDLGAPGVLVRNARYWWRPSPREVGFATTAGCKIECIADEELSVAIRRWIASRFAWYLDRRIDDGSVGYPNLLAAAHDASDAVSNDADIALRALSRELRERPTALTAWGYRGPDDWYTDTPTG